MTNDCIPALLPHHRAGHQFLLYGGCCSDVPDALHERTFASVNSVVRRLKPQPEFILFPGDEVIGLTPDQDILARKLAVVLHHMLRDKTNFIPHKMKPMAV